MSDIKWISVKDRIQNHGTGVLVFAAKIVRGKAGKARIFRNAFTGPRSPRPQESKMSDLYQRGKIDAWKQYHQRADELICKSDGTPAGAFYWFPDFKDEEFIRGVLATFRRLVNEAERPAHD